MVNLGRLSEKSIRRMLGSMARRSALSGPFHVFLYWLTVVNTVDLEQGHYWIGLWWMVGLSALRLSIWFNEAKFFVTKRGRFAYRAILGAIMVGIGLVWGLSCAAKFVEHGITTSSLTTLAFCFGIAAISAAAFSFDFVPATAFQLVLMLPVVYVLHVKIHDPAVLSLTVGIYVYLALMTFTAAGLARFQFSIVADSEIIDEQRATLEAANETMSSMLESIGEAFLKFDERGICVSAPGEKAKALLALNPSGLHLCDVLRVPEAKQKTIKSWYSMLIAERMAFNELLALGILSLRVPETGTTLSLKYHPIRDRAGKIRAITVTASDITREVQAEEKAKVAMERATLVLRVQENRIGFRSFLEEFEDVLDRAMTWKSDDISDLRRDLHTLKGTAALFGANALAEVVHAAEMRIREHAAAGGSELVRECGLVLNQEFLLWRNREMDLFLQLGVFEHNYVEVSKRKLSEMAARLSRDLTASRHYREFVRDLLSSEFGELWKDFEFHVEKTAQSLGKKVRFLVASSGTEGVSVSPAAYRDVLRSFIHLFNNAIDHGIETPEVRAAKGKPVQGTIRVTYEPLVTAERKQIRILVEDDGRGIDVEILRGLKRNLRASASLSDLDIAQTIFEDGLSTRDAVTEISGQGIGMGSVRAAVLKAGGSIRVLKTDQGGTTFEVLLPHHTFDGRLRMVS